MQRTSIHLKNSKPSIKRLKVQLIDQNDLMLSAEDDRHVVVAEVAAVVVNDVNSIARVVIQNHLKSHSRKKKVQELVIGELLRMNFKVRQRRLTVRLKAKRLKKQRKKLKTRRKKFHHQNQKRRQ